MYGELIDRDTIALAISQEDTEVDEGLYSTFLGRLAPGPYFDVLIDVERQVTTGYDRTTGYLIDKEGIVRQIFPQIIHARPSWAAFLPELDRFNGTEPQSGM